MYQDVEYNGMKGSNLRLFAKERPAIPAAKKRGEEIVVPGRDGILFRDTGEYEPTEIAIAFNYIGKEEDWARIWRRAQDWLGAMNCRLRFADDARCFFWITKVQLSEAERTSKRIGNFKATFLTRDGLYYLEDGLREYEIADVRWNPYGNAHPIYKITGEGVCALSVNGREMIANVGQNLTIDTERMMTYRTDGILQNTAVTGDYEWLYLKKGENKITITNGFRLKVIPNWRYTP